MDQRSCTSPSSFYNCINTHAKTFLNGCFSDDSVWDSINKVKLLDTVVLWVGLCPLRHCSFGCALKALILGFFFIYLFTPWFCLEQLPCGTLGASKFPRVEKREVYTGDREMFSQKHKERRFPGICGCRQRTKEALLKQHVTRPRYAKSMKLPGIHDL